MVYMAIISDRTLSTQIYWEKLCGKLWDSAESEILWSKSTSVELLMVFKGLLFCKEGNTWMKFLLWLAISCNMHYRLDVSQ